MNATEPDLKPVINRCFENPESSEKLEAFDSALRPFLLAVLVGIYRHDPSLAEDAYQSAFVKYIEIFRAGKKPSIEYEGYFVAIAKNCLIDELRRRKRSVPIDEIMDVGTGASQPNETDRAEARIMVFQVMMKLGRRCQFILESYYINEMNSETLAQRLQINRESVHMAVKRCRDELRELTRLR